MKSLRTVLTLDCVTVPILAPSPADAQGPTSGVHDFDFLQGEWRAHHRRLRPDTRQWEEFEGTWTTRTLLDGTVNVEEHALGAPRGAYQALALRAYDSKARQWAIGWLDGREPSVIRAPVRGRFENGIGTFYSEYVQDGKSMKGRFLWSHITPRSPGGNRRDRPMAGRPGLPTGLATLEHDSPSPTPGAAGGGGDFGSCSGTGRSPTAFFA